jgi:hypothetical protein
MDAIAEKEKRTSKKNMDGSGKAAMKTRNLEPVQWRNREECFWIPEDGDSCYKTGWIDRQ